jgi:hypothetical protein
MRSARRLIVALAVSIAAAATSAAEPLRIDGRIVAIANDGTLTLR